MSTTSADDMNGDGRKDVWVDTNGDGTPDAVDFDANGFTDGALVDIYEDGVPDAIDIDNDGSSELWFLPVTSSGAAPARSNTPTQTIATSIPSPEVSTSVSMPSTFITSSTVVTRSPSPTSADSPAETNLSSQSTASTNTNSPAETTLSSQPTASTNANSSGPPVGAIAGGAVGGLLAIAVILGFVWLIMRERRKRARNLHQTPTTTSFKESTNGEVGGSLVSELGGIQDDRSSRNY